MGNLVGIVWYQLQTSNNNKGSSFGRLHCRMKYSNTIEVAGATDITEAAKEVVMEGGWNNWKEVRRWWPA